MSTPKLLFMAIFAFVLTVAAAQTRKACRAQAKLICVLRPTKGNKVSGTVKFSPIFKKGKCLVQITASVRGLTPGQHGFHIHSFGDLSNTDGTSAGGHFTNPELTDVDHGFNDSPVRHWGDFGNLNANKSGKASFSLTDSLITLEGIVGRGMVVHELADMGPDFQPTGGAGSRQASCVIGFANPTLK